MSEQTAEAVRRAYKAFNRGDLEGMFADAAPEFEYLPTGAIPGAGDVYRGAPERHGGQHLITSLDQLVDLNKLWKAERRGDQLEPLAAMDGAGRQVRARAGIHGPERSPRSRRA
jgi:ketosteroid isomerase-like protein